MCDDSLVQATLSGLAASYDGEALDAALDDFGFAELIQESAQLGVSSLFEALGRAGASCGALNDVLTTAVSSTTDIDASGDTVLLPRPGEGHPATADRGTIRLDGLAIAPRAGRALVVAAVGTDGIGWFRVTSSESIAPHQIHGLDPALGLVRLEADSVAAEQLLGGPAAARTWDAAVAAARRALSAQIAAGVEQMLSLATEHAKQRVQFGRPIGSFQAVRHRLAEVSVALHAAKAATEQSWQSDDEVLGAMVAKSLAGRAARIAGVHCQQVLAGIGFTAEHPFHASLKRTIVLDRLIGSSAELPTLIGARLAAAGTVPRLVAL
ncbi:MAG TPA: acyl-CoA dehydrogenase family protein [Mycobacteriales bacterium]|nr:acyl-CoA dehydrogenase family protein [Mycobacteriales bacterium]